MSNSSKIFVFLALLSAHSLTSLADPKPKYGPEAIPLSRSHDYFRKNEAPDYWALSPYYAAQFNEQACSVAAVTMILNAARRGLDLTSEEPLVTQQNLLIRVGNNTWKKAVGKQGRGVTLDQLAELTRNALTTYGFNGSSVEVIRVDDPSPVIRSKLHKILEENERSARNFVVANFIQGVFTGDAEVGHIAPVGAYDAKLKRVLILDPDREWYEPYWVSEETFLKGMATWDKTANRSRGYVWIKME